MKSLVSFLAPSQRRSIEKYCDEFEKSAYGTASLDRILGEAQSCSLERLALIEELAGIALEKGDSESFERLRSSESVFDRGAIDSVRLASVKSESRVLGDISLNEDPDSFPKTERFDYIDCLGVGGMGIVFHAFDKRRQMEVALKVSKRRDGAAHLKFRREFHSLTRIHHRNLINFFEFFEQEGSSFFTMEFVVGLDPIAYCMRKDRLDEERIISVLSQIAEGLECLHGHGKIHRDLKPSNILVDQEGRVRILDFGLAVETNQLIGEYDGYSYAGTDRFRSPEQMACKPLTSASDWYSVGMILRDLLSEREWRRQPSKRDSILLNLVEGLVRGDPSARFTGRDVLDRLGRWNAKAGSSRLVDGEIFVGRVSQLNELEEQLANASKLSICLVSGISGAGKSALIRRFLENASRDPENLVVYSRCSPKESVSFPGLDGVVEGLAERVRRMSSSFRKTLVPAEVGSLLQAFPVLGIVPEFEAAAGAQLEKPIDPVELRRLAVRSLSQLLIKVGLSHRLVFVIDDLQWNGVQSLSVLADLFSVGVNLCFVGCCRSEHPSFLEIRKRLSDLKVRSVGDSQFREIDVGALEKHEARSLALSILGEGGMGIEAISRIVEEAKGHPYFLLELLRGIGEERTMTLNDVLGERIGNLEPKEQRLLEIVSTSSIPLSVEKAFRIAEIDEINPSLLERLADQNLLSIHGSDPSNGELVPYHDSVQEVAESHIQDPRSLHREISDALLEDRGSIRSQAIAYHLEHAGEEIEAAFHYRRAGRESLLGSAFEEAADAFKKAADLDSTGNLVDEVEARSGLAEALDGAGKNFEAAQEFEWVAPHLDKDEGEEVLVRAGYLYGSSGHIEEGRNIFETLLRARGLKLIRWKSLAGFEFLLRRLVLRFSQPRRGEDVREEDCRKVDLLSAFVMGFCVMDPMATLNLQARSTYLAMRCGDPKRLAKAFALENFFTAVTGFRILGGADDLDRRARELCLSCGDPYLKGLYFLGKGIIAHMLCRFSQVVPFLRESEEYFVRNCLHIAWEVSTIRTVRLWSLAFLGRVRELNDLAEEYYREALERNDRYLSSCASCYALPFAKLALDREGEARGFLETALHDWGHEREFHTQHMIHLQAEMNFHLYQGNGVEALTAYERQLRGLRSSGFSFFEFSQVVFGDLYSRALIMTASHEEGVMKERRLRRALRYSKKLRKMKYGFAKAVADRIEGSAFFLRGSNSQALEKLKQSRSAFRSNDMQGCALGVARLISHVEGGSHGDGGFQSQGIVNPRKWSRMMTGIDC